MTGLVQGSRVSLGVEQSLARLAEGYGRAVVHGPSLSMSEDFVGDERFVLATTAYDGVVDVVVQMDRVIVNAPADGVTWAVGGDRGRLDAPTLFQPGAPVSGRMDGLTGRVVAFEVEPLRDLARAIYADDRLEVAFDGPRPVDDPLARQWSSAFTIASTLSGQLSSDLLRASTFRLLAVATLEAFRLRGDRSRRNETAVGLLAAYRRAVAFIDDHASLPITVADIARASGVSLANLRRAFRSQSQDASTPETHLRRIRLSLAHRDLVAGDPTRGDTVRSVALRWGFGHPGRFARWHREEYGEAPRQVLWW